MIEKFAGSKDEDTRQVNMDVADRSSGTVTVRDELAERCQKLFQDFLEE